MGMQTEAQVAQRMSALQEANRVRIARARIKEQLLAGEVELVELVLAPPEDIFTVKIGDLLEWAPGIGPFRAGKILNGGFGKQIVGRSVAVEHLSAATRARVCERIEGTHPVRLAA